MNGYNFTERVRKVLSMSREEAARLRHDYVGTEHILLGILREGEGVASTVLQNFAVDMDALAANIDAIVKKGGEAEKTGPDLPYTSRAKKTLEYAMTEARTFNHSYVGTEHLLLGILREAKGLGAQVLVDTGVTLDKARAEVLNVLGTETSADASKPRTTTRVFGSIPPSAGLAGVPVAERMRVVLSDAQTLAARAGVTSVEPIHLAMALVKHGDGVANAALERLGCDGALVLAALKAIAPSEAQPLPPEATVSPSVDVEAVMRLALGEQARSRATSLATHHLLIGLLQTHEIAAAFGTQGVTADRFRAEAQRIVG